MMTKNRDEIKYLPLGDSYTICTGTNHVNESWPIILTTHLNEVGIQTKLVGNPARNGYTTQNLIDHELPIFDQEHPDLVTLLIGVNDWVRGVDSNTFHKNLNIILDHILTKLKNKDQLVLITIPDFGVTPTGSAYADGRDISKGIAVFNDIIKSEAAKRQLICIDIFPLTQEMKDHPELIADDGLHPSAKEYALWEKAIFSEVRICLAKQ